MNHSSIHLVCGVWLAVITAAGVSHFASVQQFVTALDQKAGSSLLSAEVAPTALAIHAPTESAQAIASTAPPANPHPSAAKRSEDPPASIDSQRKFFEELLGEVRNLRHENRNLLDQLGETNRDLMKLEFRVDTHSESFRPLPIIEDRADTSFEDGFGVLPPLDEPYLPLAE